LSYIQYLFISAMKDKFSTFNIFNITKIDLGII